MSLILTILSCFIVIAVMMLAMGIGIVFGRDQLGTSCGKFNENGMDACCHDGHCNKGSPE